ncbi:MAG TPA: hypothetical protein ENK18_27055 [Deltaproteobacteria bacterium]|nr:hypothetical protein [Deltaproteobacteria bacterium]
MKLRLCVSVALCWGTSCTPPTVPADKAPTEDTDTEDDPEVLSIDTSVYIPVDTAPDVVPDLQPSDWIQLRHQGLWSLSGSPFTDLSGQLILREYLNVLDTAIDTSIATTDTAYVDPYLCNVTYSLTGSAIDNHTCATCSFVFEVEHYVSDGDPSLCREPDTPPDGAVWQLGYNAGTDEILLNYYGTDVWLPWYDTTTGPPNIAFEWSFSLAIELEDTGDGG